MLSHKFYIANNGLNACWCRNIVVSSHCYTIKKSRISKKGNSVPRCDNVARFVI